MVHYFSSNFKLGILGGGQLGKMLLYETRKFDISTVVLDPSPQAPAKLAANTFREGDLMDYNTVLALGREVDLLTFEIEAVNVEALKQLEKEGKKVYPSYQTLEKIQDKAVQKQFFEDHGIPTSPFKIFSTKKEFEAAVEKGDISLPIVWKSATGGYDGRGVSILKSQDQLKELPEGKCIAENLVPFKNELAVIVARSPKGEVKSYPVVEMEFHPTANQVEYVLCPARIDDEVAAKARKLAEKVSQAFEHVGLLAVEMFQTKDDEILINEVAPRPHNSGHYSIEASYTNQFEQHLRAILDLPLGETKSKTGAIMVNLAGEEGHTGPVTYKNIEEIMKLPGVTPHVYGKKETRPFRKMGHVTIIHEDLAKAREIAGRVKESIKVISE
ncbi:5-(carboxyamino)imidazole ribonucleotide synthase [Antarcticibacterium flavum]|uniref:N5-carboxyaminoimidazole ribonucleotide synthase n=1 Tax=Antarcticibacterium flavum TaxID=2058175 RepID=A0A5B7X9R4_9FLAO|nr:MULTISPECIES: 5-(carboxyamino)imidazole ribonucleotide synthase [Antarcticibacterium]MCM4160471.1 5-(carboxyamino)imidazole ribonucleotide synthase [Antarcticibacterium sp. W02-3]QCY71383.1 5-(carboxyamino)imidazole ribonucleotide synthase [Antarcticibacterium flavum]